MHHSQPHITGSCLSRRAMLGGVGAAAMGACVSGCTTNPATGKSMLSMQSLETDIRQGQAAYPQMMAAMGGEYDNPRLARYVTGLGNRLAELGELPQLPFEFKVANTPIVNATALPGGKIAVTRGLLALASSEAELAGVLAHEIGHVNARHSAGRQGTGMLAQLGAAILGAAVQNPDIARIGQMAAAGWVQSYSRDQEFEADMLGVRYSSRAGYDPDAMATFLASLREYSLVEARRQGVPEQNVDQRNMMASHPRTIDRVREAMGHAGAVGVGGRAERDAFLDAINGIMFGDDPKQGIIRDRTFTHPDLRIEFTAPRGFVLRNSPNQVQARNAQGITIAFDIGNFDRARTARDHLVYEWAKGLTLQAVREIRLKAGRGHMATAILEQRGGQAGLTLVVLPKSDRSVWRFAMITPLARVQEYTRPFGDMLDSFRYLSAREVERITPMTLLVVPRHPDDSVRALARSLPFGAHNEEMFRVLNDLASGGASLQDFARIKTVVG